MQLATFVGVADAPVIALARLRLSKAGLKMLCTTRAQAINILAGFLFKSSSSSSTSKS